MLSSQAPIKNDDPIFGGAAITASDTVDAIAGHVCKGLMVATAGNVRLKMADGTDVVWPNVAAGIVHPFVFTRLMATNTTAVGPFAAGKLA